MTAEDTPRQGYLPLAELLAQYKPAWGEDWEDAWRLQSEGSTNELVQRLAAELRERGSFDEPVILCAESWDYDEEVGEEYYPASVGNGMHRLGAHRLTGIDPVFVQDGFPKFDQEAYEKERTLYVRLRILAEGDRDEEYKKFEDVLELLSWRHEGTAGSHWLRVGGGAGGEDASPYWEVELFFEECSEAVVPSEVQEDIATRLAAVAVVDDVYWESNAEPEEDEDDA